MGNTTFQAPVLQGGPATGVSSTDTRTACAWQKNVLVSARGRDITFTLPDNASIHGATGFVITAVSALGQGAKILVGDGTTDNLYGTANAVVALGSYTVTMAQGAVSAKTVVVKVTASVAASSADMTQGKIQVSLIGGYNLNLYP